jgi:uncharacterized protein (DUF1501 family)
MIPANRRQFLQQTLGSATLLSAGVTVPMFLARSALAAGTKGGAGGRVLVVVQLSGGNDGLNTVVPFADPEYGRHRIALNIPKDQVLKLDDHVGLHPQMTGLNELFKEGQLAVVQGVGYPNPDRSHFRSMDIWHSAQREVEQPRDGWLGRYLDQSTSKDSATSSDVPALHLGPNYLPLALASRSTAVPSVESLEGFRLRTAGGAVPLASLRTLAETERPSASSTLDFLRRSTLNAYASSQQVQEALEEKGTQGEYPSYRLAEKLKHVAQLIDAGLSTRIYYVSLGGFDTHANQLQTHGLLLKELSDSVAAFLKDVKKRGHLDRVMVMSFSEFGRRVHENASQGTDHGAAAPLFLAGGAVKAGVIGKHPSLTDLDEGDLKFHTDFRQVYATLLDSWLGCPSVAVLGKQYDKLAVLKG